MLSIPCTRFVSGLRAGIDEEAFSAPTPTPRPSCHSISGRSSRVSLSNSDYSQYLPETLQCRHARLATGTGSLEEVSSHLDCEWGSASRDTSAKTILLDGMG